jgi:DNA-binding Lrp family transcriptional regulator
VVTRRKRELDEKDQLILAALREHCRISINKLAKSVGLSPTPCRQRVERLEKLKYITKYTIVEGERAPAKFMLVTCNRRHNDTMKQIEQYLLNHKSISEIYMTEGTWDYIVLLNELSQKTLKDIVDNVQSHDAGTYTASIVTKVVMDKKILPV